MIIDCHCHAGTGDGLSGPWDTRASLRDYLRRADQAGIDRTVLFPPFHSDYRLANRQTGSIAAQQAERFFFFAFVHARRDRGRVAPMVREAVVQFRCAGIKVHHHDARISRRSARPPGPSDCRSCDVLGEVSTVELIATEYPDVPFIIPHLGSFADDWQAQRAMLDQLVRHPNVFADTSGVRRFDLLTEAVRRAGPGKILFGSDGPWLHPGLELAKSGCSGFRRRQNHGYSQETSSISHPGRGAIASLRPADGMCLSPCRLAKLKRTVGDAQFPRCTTQASSFGFHHQPNGQVGHAFPELFQSHPRRQGAPHDILPINAPPVRPRGGRGALPFLREADRRP